MKKKSTITGIILAGGKSSRMGEDKGFLKLNGKTFMSSIIAALNPIVGEIIIVSNNSEYDVFNLKRVADSMEDSGPLAGLYSGLLHSETENNIVLSCDVPLISTSVLKKLLEGAPSEAEVIQFESEGKTMPLVAMYKKKCRHHFLKLLQTNERRLRFAIDQLDVKTITLDSELGKTVRNINTISELKDLKHEFED
ncbi:molybdenum cofactor guanylyltransferase [Ulvibacter sp.]|nr:molybdenum cofactor guanylyltransferase [Ulvibacter sp.]|tara:strand:- start:2366 stop:2950 length:585 start_codon:yes stop_codon:yes gene_type:complete